MKKLLSLLSVVTIGGTAIPTTIAASPYQKKEEKLDIIKRNILTNTSFAKKVNGLPENKYLSNLEILSNDTVYVEVNDELYKSNDLITFNLIGKDINNKFNDYKNVTTIAVAQNGTLFLGTVNGLYKSTDGITFNKVGGIIENENISLIKITKYNVVYVGTQENGLYKSEDNGESFNKLNIPSKKTQYWSIDIHPKSGSLFVTTSSGYSERANVYKSNDGNYFVEVNGIPWGGAIYNEIKFFGFAPNGDIYIRVNIQNGFATIRGDGSVVQEITSKLYKSSDSFNFSEVTTLPSNIWVESFAVGPNGEIYIGTRPGTSYISSIYKSQDNGKSFNKVNGIPEKKGVCSIIVSSNGTVYAGLNREIYKSTDGNNFEKIIGAEVDDISWNLYFSSNEKILYIKTNFSLYYINNNNQLLTNEIFEKWYEFLEHDKLKVKFNFNTINKIKNILNNNKKEEAINKLKLIINNITKSDHSGAGGSITDDDVNVMAIFIWEHYSYFNEKILSLNNNQSIIIETNTIGYFDNINSNNSIYIN